ncbi:hypothetical protein F2P81_013367 [Scophthalmus maximus]|uniref:Uncharacterized protein n=1 Tax=Scophthalmus maximus TaxID=52904 RepID=A0A6A4SSF4_SCOMX|nr:hypothetical protein F2P81_013367 [Scophthalmus maximus]
MSAVMFCGLRRDVGANGVGRIAFTSRVQLRKKRSVHLLCDFINSIPVELPYVKRLQCTSFAFVPRAFREVCLQIWKFLVIRFMCLNILRLFLLRNVDDKMYDVSSKRKRTEHPQTITTRLSIYYLSKESMMSSLRCRL